MKPDQNQEPDEKDSADEPAATPPTAPQTGVPPAGDARDKPEKLKQNREHLGVDEEHKTPDMEKGHRGTYP